MANLSKLKRERMLGFLNELKKSNKDNEKVIQAVNEIENELKEKKYGLVWEEHSEDVDEKIIDNAPVLNEDKSREIITSKENNDLYFLIEGDNLHSLKLLDKTHHEKIDVIYIDPPYNTGNEDFIYNDKYVGADDGYRHSKWLSFMSIRLKIARELLKKDGFIMISIDDNEYAQLKILCDDIFGEINRLTIQHVQVRYDNKSLNEKNDWQPVMEYVLLYAKDKMNFKVNKPYDEYNMDKFIYEIEELSTGEEIEMGGKRVTIFKPKEWRIKKHKNGAVGLLKETWASGSVLKGNTSGKFFDNYISKRKKIDGLCCLYKVEGIGEDGIGFRYFTGPQKDTSTRGKFYSGVPLERISDINNGGSKKYKPITNFFDFSADFGNIRHEGGVGFNSGKKPIKMLKEFINYHPSKEAIILDFFAGSGSTGHAVLDLNKEDGGNRKFILCTNNESNICSDVTYPRVKTVITGIRPDGTKYSDGIKANLKYYRTDFIPNDSETFVDDLIAHTDEMIQLEYGVRIDKDKYISILTDKDADDLEKNWDKYPNIKAIYVSRHVLLSSDQNELFHRKDVYIIPDYYYREELREVGE